MNNYLFVPKIFVDNVNEIIASYPPVLPHRKVKKDVFFFILHQIIMLPIVIEDFQKYLYTPLSSKKMREFHKNWKHYANYLIDNNVIETDNKYIPDEKAIGYRLAEAYQEHELQKVEVSDYTLKKALAKIKSTKPVPKEFRFLQKNLDKLEIDVNNAITFFEILIHKQIADERRSGKFKTEKAINWLKEHKTKSFDSSKFPVLELNTGIKGHFDQNIYRFHSPITRMKKEMRNFLKYDGQEMVNIDIKNSQPYFLSAILTPEFFDVENTRILSLSNKRIQKNNKLQSSTIMMAKNELSLDKQDVQEYKNLVVSGEFYEFFLYHIAQMGKSNIIPDRNTAKTATLSMLYEKNDARYPKLMLMRYIFSEAFPTVFKIMNLVKKDNYKTLSKYLQRIESISVIHEIALKIHRSNPQIPIITIHDSISTTLEHEATVKDIIHSELHNLVGVAPMLESEYWRSDTAWSELENSFTNANENNPISSEPKFKKTYRRKRTPRQ